MVPWEISLQHELKAGWADSFLLKFRKSWLSHHLPYKVKYVWCLSEQESRLTDKKTQRKSLSE